MGAISNLFGTPTPTPDAVPISDGSGHLDDWVTSGSSGIPGGADTQLQYNNTGAFGGISGATTDGTITTFLANNLKATTPWITTGIKDSAGLSILAFSPAGTAVNQLTLANAAAASSPGPSLSATGTDTDINFTLTPKGAGVLKLKIGVLLDASSYLNWGATVGTGGYGFRDSGGTMQFKNSGGAWAAFGGGSGDVTGPASSVDNELAVYNSTTGKIIKAGTGITATPTGILTFGAGGATLGGSGGTLNVGGALTLINANGGAITAGPATTVFQIAGADSTNPRLVVDAFAGVAGVFLRRANTSNAAKSAVQSGDQIGAVNCGGYKATQYSLAAGFFNYTAAENWTDSAIGTTWNLGLCPTGSTSQSTLLQYSSQGVLTASNAAAGGAVFTLSAAGALSIVGALTTGAPSGGTAAPWKFGVLVTAAVTPDTTRYLQADVGGTLYKVIVAA